MADGKIVIETLLDDDELIKGITNIENKAKSGMKASTLAIGAFVTTIGTATLASVKFGSEFESSMAKVSTLVDTTKTDMGLVSDALVKISSETGKSSKELAEASYSALSAGVSIDELTETIYKSSKLSVGGFTNVEKAVDVTTSVVNAYGKEVISVDKAQKILMQTQNKGKTTIDELASSISQVTPTASSMNVSFEQVGASLSNITAKGTPTAQATTMLNSLFAELGKSGTTASRGLANALDGTKYAEQGFSELMKQGVPLNEILDLMDGYAQSSGKSLLDMFGSIEAGKAALSLAGQNSKTFSDNLSAMSTEVNVVDDAYNKMADTLEFKTDVVKESTKNLGIQFYKELEEPLKKACDVAIDSIDSVSGMLPNLISGFKDTFNVAKKLSPVIFGVASGFIALKVVQQVSKYTDAFKKVSAGLILLEQKHVITMAAEAGALTAKQILVGITTRKITLATAAQWLWNKAILANPIAATAVAIAGLTTAVIVYADKISKLNKEEVELVNSSKKLKDETKEIANSTVELSNSVEDTSKGFKDSGVLAKQLGDELTTLNAKENKTVEDKQKIASLVGQLNGLLPDLNLAYDENTDKLNKNNSEIKKSIENAIKLAESKALEEKLVEISKKQVDAKLKLIEVEKKEQESKDKLAKLQKQQQQALKENTGTMVTYTGATVSTSAEVLKLNDKIAKTSESVRNNKNAVENCKIAIDNLGQTQSTVSQMIESNRITTDVSTESIKKQGWAAMNTANQTISANEQIQASSDITSQEVVQDVQNQIDIFSDFDEKNTISKDKLLSNMREQVIAAQNWELNLVDIMGRTSEDGTKILDDGIIQYLQDMGPAGASYIAAMATMTDEELEEANSLWGQSLTLQNDIQGQFDGVGEEVASGINKAKPQVLQSGRTLMELTASNMITTLNSKKSDARNAGKDMANTVTGGMTIANMPFNAKNQADLLVSSVVNSLNNGKSNVSSSGKGLADSTVGGMKSVDMYGNGTNQGGYLASGVANGIRINENAPIFAAKQMMERTLLASKNTAVIKSPSHVMQWQGKMLNEGLAKGQLDNIGIVTSASEQVMDEMLNGVNIPSAVQKMEHAIMVETSKLTTALTSNVHYSNSQSEKDGGVVNQTVNINQTVKSPIETSREIRKAGRELAFG